MSEAGVQRVDPRAIAGVLPARPDGVHDAAERDISCGIGEAQSATRAVVTEAPLVRPEATVRRVGWVDDHATLDRDGARGADLAPIEVGDERLVHCPEPRIERPCDALHADLTLTIAPGNEAAELLQRLLRLDGERRRRQRGKPFVDASFDGRLHGVTSARLDQHRLEARDLGLAEIG
jgi:hypothetical protein